MNRKMSTKLTMAVKTKTMKSISRIRNTEVTAT